MERGKYYKLIYKDDLGQIRSRLIKFKQYNPNGMVEFYLKWLEGIERDQYTKESGIPSDRIERYEQVSSEDSR